ncbi:hypothetical protein ACHWQZ_G016367 [Mnemiopsis leidyi]
MNQTSCPDQGTNKLCDMICNHGDLVTCQDESYCNGFNYGVWCDNYTRYIPVPRICDGVPDCQDEMDENICQVDNKTQSTCMLFKGGNPEKEIIIPLYSFTRCRPLTHFQYTSILFHYCEDFLDQTNCSDKSRVGLYCPIHGFMSTVSKQVVCSTSKKYTYGLRGKIPPICDDSLEKACVDASYSCVIHKHQLCDGSKDCHDNSDEVGFYCQHLADQFCVRRFVFEKPGYNVNFSIPMEWVHDGVTDCMNGEDEMENWPTCGRGRTFRLKDRFNRSCSEVFLCAGSHDVIEFPRLCDKINSCGNENQICLKSRDQPATVQHAFRSDDNVVMLLYCLKGLESILDLKKESCVRQKFISSERTIFGKNHSLDVWLPRTKIDCKFFYGESYVFLSCLQKCISSRCPLNLENKERVNHFCPKQFGRTKVLSVDDHGNLAVLIKNAKTGQLNSDIFSCKSSPTCLTYDKVRQGSETVKQLLGSVGYHHDKDDKAGSRDLLKDQYHVTAVRVGQLDVIVHVQ